MLKKILIAVMVISCFAACKGRSAFNYNQDFVKKETDLIPEITKAQNKIENFLAKEQYDSIGATAAHAEKVVDEQLQKITNDPIPDVTGGPEFKKACINYFAYIKSIYTGYKNFGNASTENRETEMNKLIKIEDTRMSAMNDIKVAQQKFASANGFRVEAQ